MAARLGNALYWVATTLAFAWAAFSAYAEVTSDYPDWKQWFMVGLLPAAIVWAIGRAIKYVLAAN